MSGTRRVTKKEAFERRMEAMIRKEMRRRRTGSAVLWQAVRVVNGILGANHGCFKWSQGVTE